MKASFVVRATKLEGFSRVAKSVKVATLPFLFKVLKVLLKQGAEKIQITVQRRTKDKLLQDFSFATQAEYPELAEVFLKLREPGTIITGIK